MANTIDMIYLTTNLRECPERSEISHYTSGIRYVCIYAHQKQYS